MFRQALAFLTSSFALLFVAAIALAWSRPSSVLSAAILALILLTAFCIGASVFRFPSRATIAGLLTGALLFNAIMVIFDWALTHPETQSLTFGGFLHYLHLYRSSSAAFLVAPFLLSLLAFSVGRSLTAAAARFRRSQRG